jgi:SAM-dependent methyltransferase
MESIQPLPQSPDAAIAHSIYYQWSKSAAEVLGYIGFKQATGIEPNPQGIVDFFADKMVLDAGSGEEDFAKGVQVACAEAGKNVTVVNLNPHLSAKLNMKSETDLVEPGALNEQLQALINMDNKYYGGVHGMYPYITDEKDVPEGTPFLRRNALAAYLQDAPFADGTFDVIISSWYYPDSLLARKNETTIITAEESAKVEELALKSLRELTRLLTPDGVVLLGPAKDNGDFEELFARYPEWRKTLGSVSGGEEVDQDPLVLIAHKESHSYELRHASYIATQKQLKRDAERSRSIITTMLDRFFGHG